MDTTLAELDRKLKEALALPTPPEQSHIWKTMTVLQDQLSLLLRDALLEEEAPKAATGDDDDFFSGIPQPTFSIGSPGPPPEEADLINVGDARLPSLDDILGELGASVDLLAPTPLIAPSRASPILQQASACPRTSACTSHTYLATPSTVDEPEVEEEHADVEAKVNAWIEKNQNLRALLSTLHQVVPCSWDWEPTALAELVDRTAVLEAYRRAAFVVHPDKLRARGRSARDQDRGQSIFTALKCAEVAFKRGR